MTPKDRVRANIYKTLLEEEKRKNRRRGVFSLSLFVLGIFTSSTYQMLFKEVPMTGMDTAAFTRRIMSQSAFPE